MEYISQYAEFTEKNGEYWALSPLKEEKTASFSVRRETNSFYDFASGVGGNVLTFIRFYEGCSRGQAVEKLKKYAGVTGNLTGGMKKMAATEVAKRFQSKEKPKQQSKSIILPPDQMSRYERDMEKLELWVREGISEQSLDRFQVRYDPFSSRIVYPIRDTKGNIINVSGRTIDPSWKEKGLRKYTYFQPLGILDTVYGLSENREYIEKTGEIILFEGAKSVMIADTWGIRNCGAILTSHLNPQQLRILAKLGCRVVFALDEDVDPTQDHNIAKLKQLVNVQYIRDTGHLLQEKMSPVDAGPEVWKTLYDGRRSYR